MTQFAHGTALGVLRRAESFPRRSIRAGHELAGLRRDVFGDGRLHAKSGKKYGSGKAYGPFAANVQLGGVFGVPGAYRLLYPSFLVLKMRPFCCGQT